MPHATINPVLAALERLEDHLIQNHVDAVDDLVVVINQIIATSPHPRAVYRSGRLNSDVRAAAFLIAEAYNQLGPDGPVDLRHDLHAVRRILASLRGARALMPKYSNGSCVR